MVVDVHVVEHARVDGLKSEGERERERERERRERGERERREMDRCTGWAWDADANVTQAPGSVLLYYLQDGVDCPVRGEADEADLALLLVLFHHL